MYPNDLKDETKITIWLEQYKQVNGYIRDYRTIHWQIAAALYILMGIMTGYGLPNVEETMGKGLVCFSTFLIFLLHVTTYYYFKVLQYIKKEELKKIIEGIKKINDSFRFLEENNNKKICKFWSIHPEFGFVIIFFALFCLGVASWNYPKIPQMR